MSLINCPECNKLISDKAQICLGCGAPVEVEEQFSIVGTPVKFCNLEIAEIVLFFTNANNGVFTISFAI